MRLPVPGSALARFEFQRFRGRLPKIALAFVLCVPLLYSAVYLSANWDPYHKVNRLPVALVNEDQGTTFEGRPIDAGADLVASMHKRGTFDFQDATAAEAQDGLAHGRYYLTVYVPPTFSADLTSGAGGNPQRASIQLTRNDANGFVVGSIVAQAQNAIAIAVDEAAEEAYFKAVFANLSTIREGFAKAVDGSAQLADGLKKADEGSGKLATGATEADAGAGKLASGAEQLNTGLQTAKSGSASLASGLDQLQAGAGKLSTGAGQVADGTQQLNDKVLPVIDAVQEVLPKLQKLSSDLNGPIDDITSGIAQGEGSVKGRLDEISDHLDTLVANDPSLADDPAYQAIRDQLSQASGQVDTVAAGAAKVKEVADSVNDALNDPALSTDVSNARGDLVKLNPAAHQVASGAKELQGKLGEAATGAHSLADGISTAADGSAQLATGARSLADGLGTLQTGATDLYSGIGKLDTGATTLHDALASGLARIPAFSDDQTADAVQVLSSPVDVGLVAENPAVVYGRGLAPLFFSIALWVFGVSVFLVVRPISGRALAGRGNPIRLALTGWLPIGTIAVLAGWIMVGVVWAFLGLDPIHGLMLLGMVTLGAVCFSAIAHLLRTALGAAGTSILLVWLILQLASTGGTFPAPLLPPFFAAISHVMPMTYLIDAFRITISGGLMQHLVRDVVVLGLGALLALGLCVLVVRRRQQFTMDDLHPPLAQP